MSKVELPSRLNAPGHQSDDADVEQSYRLFLPRETIVMDAAAYSLTALIASFLTSNEFRAKLDVVNGTLVLSEAMLTELSPDLLEWVISTTELGFVRDDGPADRLSVIRTLLRDDAVRAAITAVGLRHLHHIDALNTALLHFDEMVALVGASALFDTTYYTGQLPADKQVANPAAHYTLYGERLGFKPSSTFDAVTYAELNPDVGASEFNRLFHYEKWGRSEGRVHRPWHADHPMPPVTAGSGRATVLLLLHEATYTGAPILGWNLVRALSDRCDVVVVLRCGGALESALRDVAAAVVAPPPYETTLDSHQMIRFAARLVAVYQPLYVIANSVESRPIAIALRYHNIPVVGLIHEFWPGAAQALRLDFYASCEALVFPARLVEQSSLYAFLETGLQDRFILPQGACAIPSFDPVFAPPSFGAPFISSNDAPTPLDALLTDGGRRVGAFTVIGLGAVEMRKGIDLFMSAATAMRAKHPNIAFRFIWIGSWEHAIGSPYAALLDEQYERCDLGDQLHFFPAIDDLEPVYARADALFLSSRLDPLPNVTIDAAFHGIPVICFARASGMAELLSADPDVANLVVPHLDSGAAADCLATLAGDVGLWTACSEAMQRFARRSFDMSAYAQALDAIGHDAARKLINARTDQRLIEEAEAFDASIYFVANHDAVLAATTPAGVYINQTRHINFALPPVLGLTMRRPKAGFHPFIYGTEASDFPHDGSRDPLAHYVEHGMPAGRWAHRVLRLDPVASAGEPIQNASPEGDKPKPHDTEERPSSPVALHGHFQNPDTIDEFMTALAVNRLHADLFLTAATDEAADILRSATSDYRHGSVVVEIDPDARCDIHAFLRVLCARIDGHYELVGHLSGDRGVYERTTDPDEHDHRRRFLWEHVLGPTHRAADAIVDAMQRDDRLGLVFPENGALIGWEKDDGSTAALARRLGLKALPAHIESLACTIFWARVATFNTLLQLELGDKEKPADPAPIEHSMLHALEHLLPLLCENAGYTYATSYIPQLGQ